MAYSTQWKSVTRRSAGRSAFTRSSRERNGRVGMSCSKRTKAPFRTGMMNGMMRRIGWTRATGVPSARIEPALRIAQGDGDDRLLRVDADGRGQHAGVGHDEPAHAVDR